LIPDHRFYFRLHLQGHLQGHQQGHQRQLAEGGRGT